MTYPILPEGVTLIKDSEGLRRVAYRDTGGIWTIGYGHTGPDVKPDLMISMTQAEALFVKDLKAHADGVLKLVKTATAPQLAALSSFAFNLGLGKLAKSTLLKKHNAGDHAGATAEFGKWVYGTVNGKKKRLPGLVIRRAREAALYSKKGAQVK